MKNKRTLIIVLALAIIAVLVFVMMRGPVPQQPPPEEAAGYGSDTTTKMPSNPPVCPCDSVVISQQIIHTRPASSSANQIQVVVTVTCNGAPWKQRAVRIKGAGIDDRKETDGSGIARTIKNMGNQDSTGATIISKVICTPAGGGSSEKSVSGTVPTLQIP